MRHYVSTKQILEVVVCRCYYKFRKILWKTPALKRLFNIVAGLRPATFLRDSSTAVFLWNLINFWGHILYRKPLDDLFLESPFVSLDKSLFANTINSQKNHLFEGAKTLCWILGLLHFLKQWGFCSVNHSQQALRKR